jgi:predicted alpha/beta superfamily hydrolase
MLKLKLFIGLLSFFFSVSMSYSQITKVETPGPSGVKFRSVIDSQEYVLYINIPEGYDKSNKKYPVLYATDGQWTFTPLSNAYGGQRYDGFVPDLIVVGITWTGDYDANRFRDLSPTHIDNFPNSGNASKFLSVIKNEIITFVDSTYRTDKNDRALFGTSLGGLFAVYALFHEPSLFKRYIIASPSIFWDNEIVFKYEKMFAEKNHELNARVFISTGEYEKEMDAGNSFTRFINQVRASKYKGLELESIVLDKMGHAGSAAISAVRGIQFIYSKPELLLDTVLLSQYTGRYVFDKDSMVVTRTGNSIYINNASPGGRIRLHAETSDLFHALGMNGTGQFKRDTNGKVTSYELVLPGVTMVFKKID